MNKAKQTTYATTAQGIVIEDRRQTTNGAIIPNYLVDLYLPIIGYVGIGVLTTLYRLANSRQALIHLSEFAKAGRLGFRTLKKILDKLVECRLIKYQKPEGGARWKHLRTVVQILDAPKKVPAPRAQNVARLTVVPWLFAGHPRRRNKTPKLSDDNSMK